MQLIVTHIPFGMIAAETVTEFAPYTMFDVEQPECIFVTLAHTN
jgi:hypothetical protein